MAGKLDRPVPTDRPVREVNMEEDSVTVIMAALAPLLPERRVAVLSEVGCTYCRHCGYPVPELGCNCIRDD
jgi:hypothetical protein